MPKMVLNLRPLIYLAGFAAVVSVGDASFLMPRHAFADSVKTKEADALRRDSQAKAKSQIGYPDIFDYLVRSDSSDTNYTHISRQIEQLSRYLRDVSRALGNAVPPGLPPPGGGQGDVKAVYGSDGPTVKSVSALLEYRLITVNNPRLKVGKVTEDDSAVRAEIVTKDGSLVDAYLIDKKTGAWNPIR